MAGGSLVWIHCQNVRPVRVHNLHYNDVITGAMVSQITNLTIVYSTVYSDADQRKYQSSASLAFVREIHRWPVNSPHKWPVTRKMFPLDGIIMFMECYTALQNSLTKIVAMTAYWCSLHLIIICVCRNKLIADKTLPFEHIHIKASKHPGAVVCIKADSVPVHDVLTVPNGTVLHNILLLTHRRYYDTECRITGIEQYRIGAVLTIKFR